MSCDVPVSPLRRKFARALCYWQWGLKHFHIWGGLQCYNFVHRSLYNLKGTTHRLESLLYYLKKAKKAKTCHRKIRYDTDGRERHSPAFGAKGTDSVPRVYRSRTAKSRSNGCTRPSCNSNTCKFQIKSNQTSCHSLLWSLPVECRSINHRSCSIKTP